MALSLREWIDQIDRKFERILFKASVQVEPRSNGHAMYKNTLLIEWNYLYRYVYSHRYCKWGGEREREHALNMIATMRQFDLIQSEKRTREMWLVENVENLYSCARISMQSIKKNLVTLTPEQKSMSEEVKCSAGENV